MAFLLTFLTLGMRRSYWGSAHDGGEEGNRGTGDREAESWSGVDSHTVPDQMPIQMRPVRDSCLNDLPASEFSREW